MKIDNKLPIGVFDSGVGGLTVLRALQKVLPNESFLYLGDMARVPYGTKSHDTIVRYTKQACEVLLSSGIKLLVIACNTAASAFSPDKFKEYFPGIPTIAVVEPGAYKACETSQTGVIGVIATEATVLSGSYQNAIKKLRPNAQVIAKGCSLFVPLAEEGWTSGKLVEGIIKEYLTPMMADGGANMDCLVLGCTHFPILAQAIRKVIHKRIVIVDSAETTAATAVKLLRDNNLIKMDDSPGQATFLVTDAPQRFAKVAKGFLGGELNMNQIELVDIIQK